MEKDDFNFFYNNLLTLAKKDLQLDARRVSLS